MLNSNRFQPININITDQPFSTKNSKTYVEQSLQKQDSHRTKQDSEFLIEDIANSYQKLAANDTARVAVYHENKIDEQSDESLMTPTSQNRQ